MRGLTFRLSVIGCQAPQQDLPPAPIGTCKATDIDIDAIAVCGSQRQTKPMKSGSVEFCVVARRGV